MKVRFLRDVDLDTNFSFKSASLSFGANTSKSFDKGQVVTVDKAVDNPHAGDMVD